MVVPVRANEDLVDCVDGLNARVDKLNKEIREQRELYAEDREKCSEQLRCATMMGKEVETPRGQTGFVVGYQICLTPEDGSIIEATVDVDIPNTEPSDHLRYWSIYKVTCL